MTPDCIYCLLYSLIVFGIGVCNNIHEERNRIQEKYLSRNPFLPTFLTTPANITVNRGEEAILPCAVEHRGTRTVVWRLASNPSPITIGVKTYVSDTRYKVVHPRHSLEWNLHIMNAQPEDSGMYECQVSAVTRHIRQMMGLTVRDTSTSFKKMKKARTSKPSSSSSSSSSEITIKGSFFVERGDTLKLQCNATGSEYHPDEIDWFKDGNKIRNSDRITLEKHVSLSDRTITSSLHIKRGHMNDAGTYVCRTSDLQVTSVKVNVLNTESNNEKRESLESSSGSQHEKDNNSGNANVVSNQSSWFILIMVLLLVSLSHRSFHPML